MLYPDLLLDKVEDLTLELLQQYGIKGIIFDLDETLAPWRAERPPERLLEHICLLKNAGISMALVSNSPYGRVSAFNHELKLSIYPDAQKPRVKVLKRAVVNMGLPCEKIAMVGDQLFTDIMAGNRLHLLTVMVLPVEDRQTWLFRIKRRLERLILRRFQGEKSL